MNSHVGLAQMHETNPQYHSTRFFAPLLLPTFLDPADRLLLPGIQVLQAGQREWDLWES